MKTMLCIFMGFFFCHLGFAEESKATMTKIVSRIVSPQIPPDSFAAKPKTLYLSGQTYCRVEEEPDPKMGIHGLMIISEPDAWMINLYDRSCKHNVDPGPSLVIHSNILPNDAPAQFADLEYGKEVDFFKIHNAKALDAQVVDGKRCEAQEFKQDNYRLILNTAADTHTPFSLDVFKGEKLDFTIRYTGYEQNIPFNPELFKPPKDITITEAQPKDPAKKPKEMDDSWMQQYYQHPRPELFETEVKKMQDCNLLSNSNGLAPAAAFFSRLFRDAPPDRLSQWVSFIRKLPEEDQPVFLYALRWAETEKTQEALQNIASQGGKSGDFSQKLLAHKSIQIGKFTNPAPEELDMCWGAFFASGDAAYVLPVIKCAVKPEEKGRIDMSQQAAKWSLKALARTHEKIRSIKDDFYKTASPEQRKTLDDLFQK